MGSIEGRKRNQESVPCALVAPYFDHPNPGITTCESITAAPSVVQTRLSRSRVLAALQPLRQNRIPESLCCKLLSHCTLLSACCLLPTAFFLLSASGFGQQTENPPVTPQPRTSSQAPKTPEKQKPPAPAPSEPRTEDDENPPPGDWAPELLDAIANSPNAEARDTLLDAAFAAGPVIVPQLEKALQDDRTAEFAAQSLAFVGGGKAIEALSHLMQDTRDLNLRRFYYGALAEFDHPLATKLLLYVVSHGDEEQDRTVTEAAVLALTVRSDPNLVAPLQEIHSKLTDIVIKDDIENALDVIQVRARYLASPEAAKTGSSIEQAVRTYFMPALEVASSSGLHKPTASPPTTPAAATASKSSNPVTPAVKVSVEGVTYSPNRDRALAHVIFDNPAGTAYYSIVLQKRYGDWTLASVWLGSEVEKPMLQLPDHQLTPSQAEAIKTPPQQSKP
jgi:hypothetical protein